MLLSFHLLFRLWPRKTHKKQFLTYQILSLHLLYWKEISASPHCRVQTQMNDTILLYSHRSYWGKNSKKYKFHSPLPQPDLFWHCLRQRRHKNPSETRHLSVVQAGRKAFSHCTKVLETAVISKNKKCTPGTVKFEAVHAAMLCEMLEIRCSLQQSHSQS